MAARRQQQPRTIPLAMHRGMHSGGDGARLPVGYARKIRNRRLVDGSWCIRPQFTYDGLTGIQGLATFESDENEVTHMLSVDDSGVLRAKAAESETWESPATGTVTGTRLTSFASYRGKGWGATEDVDGLPVGIFSYNGTEVDSSPLTSNIVARLLLFYKERLVLFHPRVTIDNLLPWEAAYTAAAGNWNLADVDARTIAVGATTIGEIIPTATTGAFAYRDVGTITALTERLTYNWLSGIHNTSASYQMPLTLQVRIVNPWETVTPYADDEIATPSASNGYRYRAITAGTSDVAEPAWPVTIGGTVVDGTVTWLCDAANILAERKVFIPTASNSDGVNWYALSASLPPTPGGYTVRVYILFGNETSPTVTPVALWIGYRDGLADDDPGKKNYGQQVTVGDYFYPFFNVESDTAPAKDLDQAIWSEVADPARIRAISSYSFGGTAGYTQAAIVFDSLMYAFKRRSYVTMAAVEDVNIVFLPQGDETLGIGCIGPQAIAVHGGAEGKPPTLYWIGEDSVYALRAGSGNVPIDICGNRMRSEIMAKGADWVENQATHNAPILTVNHGLDTLGVYTQKGTIYVYSIADDAWSKYDAGGDSGVNPTGAEIRAMHYRARTNSVYVSFGTAPAGTPGLARLDGTQPPTSQDQISSAGTLPVYAEIWPRAIETTGPHMDVLINTIRYRQKAPADLSGQVVIGSVSTDGGATFPNSIAMEQLQSADYVPLEHPLYASWNALQPRLVHAGNGGADMSAISAVEADVVLLGGYYPKQFPTFGASTL